MKKGKVQMIYITGDTHGLNDLAPVKKYFDDGYDPDGRKVTKDDYLIILGDVACCWDGKWHDKKIRKALHELPPTILWLDDNHENFLCYGRWIFHRQGMADSGTVMVVTGAAIDERV